MRLIAIAAALGLLALFSAEVPAQPALPSEVELGKTWLMAQVQADGQIAPQALQIATTAQSEAEVIESLAYFNASSPALVQVHQQRPADPGVEHLARQIIALAHARKSTASLLIELRARQNADGGFGGTSARSSTILDTSFALVALRAAGVIEGEDISRGLNYLVSRLASPAQQDWQTSQAAEPYVAAYGLLALQVHSARFALASAIDAQRQRLLAQQSLGQFGEVLLDTVAALALQFSSTDLAGLDTLKAAIRQAQLSNGSWGNDAFLTALALRALSAGVLTPPDLDARVTLAVRDAQTLDRLAGVSLSIGELPALTIASGRDGTIDSGVLPPGTYSLRLQKEGFQSRDLGALTLAAGQTRDLGLIDLNRDTTVAVLFGYISDVSTGQPIAGANIDVSGAQARQVQTQPDGHYELRFSAGGAVSIAVSANGYQSVAASASLVTGQTVQFSPSLYPSAAQVPTQAAIKAQVVHSLSGAPIAGAVLSVGAASASADADGRLSLVDLPVAAAAASVVKAGFLSRSVPVVLAPGVNDLGVIRLQPASAQTISSLSGRVTDQETGEPLPGATVSISGSNLRASTDPDGRYRIDGISQLPINAVATAPGYGSQTNQTDSVLHANYIGDFALRRLVQTNINVSIEGLAMSAPEYVPFSEIGLRATVKNLNTDRHVDLIFNAIITDEQGVVIRDAPQVPITFGVDPSDAVIRLAANESRDIVIAWSNANDLPGSYGVRFRGVTPEGQVGAERSTSYIVTANRILGGGIIMTPPIVQAGTNTTITMTANVGNQGNLDIPSGDARLQIKLVAADDRPPVPSVPTIGPDFIAGAPLVNPAGLTEDAAGNIYTLNTTSTTQLVRISSSGTAVVLRNLPTIAPNSQGIGTPKWLQWRAPGFIRIAHGSGWTYDVDLLSNNALSNFKAPPSGVDSIDAYEAESASGLEFFAANTASGYRVLQRTAAGQTTVLVDAGIGDSNTADMGPDGKIYVLKSQPCSVFRIDPSTKVLERFWSESGACSAMAIDANGVVYLAQSNRIMRKPQNGTSEVMTTLPSLEFVDLKIGNDGALYGLMSSGTIRRITTSGANAVIAQSLMNSATGLAADGAGGFLVQGNWAINHRAENGTVTALQVGNAFPVDLVSAETPGTAYAIGNANGVYKLSQNAPQTLVSAAFGNFRAIARAGNQLWLANQVGDRYALQSVPTSGGSPTIQYRSPFSPSNVRFRSLASGELLVVNDKSIVLLKNDGTSQTIKDIGMVVYAAALSRDGQSLWINSEDGFYRLTLATGASVRLRASFSNMRGGIVEDTTGGIIFADSVARKFQRYDTVANTVIDYAAPPPGSIAPKDVLRAGNGDLVAYLSDNSVRRYSAATWSTIDVLAKGLVESADGRAGYVKGAVFYEIPASTGSAPRVVSTLPAPPSQPVWIDDNRFADYSPTSWKLTYMNAAGQTVASVVGLPNITNIAASQAGDVFVLDEADNVTRISSGLATRIGTYPTAARVQADGTEVYLATASGIVRISGDGSLLPAFAVSTWASATYRYFAVSAGRAVLENQTTHEIVVLDGASVSAQFMPLNGATAFLPIVGSKWVIAISGKLVQFDAQTTHSVSIADTSSYGKITDLTSDQSGRLYGVAKSSEVFAVDGNGTVRAVAAVTSNNANVRFPGMARDASGRLFAISDKGIVYASSGSELSFLTGGVPDVQAMSWRSGSGLLMASLNGVLYHHQDGLLRAVAELPNSLYSVCFLDQDSYLAGGTTYVSAVNARGTFSVAANISNATTTLRCGTNGTALAVSRNLSQSNFPSAVFRINAGPQTAGPQPGDIIRDQVVSVPALAMGVRRELALGDWLPPVGGDYEISLTPLSESVLGRLLTGFHVGPSVSGVLSVSPVTAFPGATSVKISAQVRGADFTHLSRADRSLIQTVGDGTFPSLMALDPQGRFWFGGNGRGLSRRGLDATSPSTTMLASAIWGKGEIPIDRSGNAYVIVRIAGTRTGDDVFNLYRVDSAGDSVLLTEFGKTEVVAMTITNQDVLYALTADRRILKVDQHGVPSTYATLPAGTPHGITRDGLGALYVKTLESTIYHVARKDQVRLLDLQGAEFEDEGVNIAGDCGEGLFMTPKRMVGTSQSGGEESTLIYLVGRTGEIGAILSTVSVNSTMDDVDFIVYDRFSSRLLMMNEKPKGSYHYYSMPVTCGAISVDLHALLASNQSYEGADPAPTQVIPLSNGQTELIWNLRDVNNQGIELSVFSRLQSLVRGESRPALSSAWLMMNNTFQPQPVRIDLVVPSVKVVSLAGLTLSLDQTTYPAQTMVQSTLDLSNPDPISKQAHLRVDVLDSSGAVVASLINRPFTLGANESTTVYPPFNTGSSLPGAYRMRAVLEDGDGLEMASAEQAFQIVAGNGGDVSVSATVAADKLSYQSGETAQLSATVRNLLSNQPLSDLHVKLNVFDANDERVFSTGAVIANLASLTDARLTFPVPLTNWASGSYRVALLVRQGEQGPQLATAPASFNVTALVGISSLSGALELGSAVIRRGVGQRINATLQNRSGQATVSGVSIVNVLDPSSLATISTSSQPFDLAAGSNVLHAVNADTSTLSLRDYLVTLVVHVGTDERVLAQKVFTVQDAVFSGSINVTPAALRPGQLGSMALAVQNTGNLSAPDSVLVTRLFQSPGNVVLREWRADGALPAGGSVAKTEVLDTSGLPLGNYQLRLAVLFDGTEYPIAATSLRVQGSRVSGVFDANPAQVARGQAVSLTGTVQNTGNIETGPLPLRIDVTRADTQANVGIFSEVANVSANQAFQMVRTLNTADLAPGDYSARFSAQVDGIWQGLSEDAFKVIQSVDVGIEMSVPRDARVLVLLSCSQQQAQATGISGAHAQTVCEQQRQAFLSAYLSERGIEHKIVLDQDAFMKNLRCGHYNVFWFSGGAVKLGVAQANEVRESIFRGDGFIVEGENDQRNSQFDEMLGHNYRGHHAGSDFPVTGSGAVFPQVARPSYGRALKLELSSGRTEAQFNTLGWPAIVSAVYGQGRSMSYAFDLVESLRRDGTNPASERLLVNGLLHVTPVMAPSDYVVGAYVPVTTTVINRGAALDARLRTDVNAPTAIVSSDPTPSSGDIRQSTWDFRLPEHDQKSFDANVLTGGTNPNIVRSEVFERQGTTLSSLANTQVTLATRDAAQVSAALLTSLRAASLSGAENAARNRAVGAIESARSLEAQGSTEAAIGKWLDAADEVRRISSVSHAEWRLAIARLLAVTQHVGCSQAIALCGTSPATPQTFDAQAFRSLSTLARVQSGGSTDWEWQLAALDAVQPSLRLNLDWKKNEATDFVLTIDAQGAGQLQLKQAGVVKASASTNVAQHGALRFGDALQFLARASSDVGTSTVTLRNLKLNDQALTQTLQSAASSAFSETSLNLFQPATGATLKLDGTIEMGFQGNSLPQGSRLELVVNAGQLQCNGGAQ